MPINGLRKAGILAVALLAACDVTNPGPINDEFLAGDPLKAPGPQAGLVNGAVRALTELVAVGNYTTALLAREIFPGGQTGSNGHDVIVQGGHVLPGSFGGYFDDAHQARYIGEVAIKRFTAINAPRNMMYQAHLWTGYSYRFLGEWWCEAVIKNTDPDDQTPGAYEKNTKTYSDRAIANLTKALELAQTAPERNWARMGRAQVKLVTGDYAGAAADAALVPDTARLIMVLDPLETAYYNKFYEATSGVFRSFSLVHTFAETYYPQTGDPRMRWDRDPGNPFATASLQGYGGRVPYLRQRKYTSRTDDQNLASGWEMRLIEAEVMLRNNNITGAMALINRVRTRNISDVTRQPLAPVTATNVIEAWTALKRERLVELWLEGRRLVDERRWTASNTPGSNDLPNFEARSLLFRDNPRSFCFDIPDSERNLNPNVPSVGG